MGEWWYLDEKDDMNLHYERIMILQWKWWNEEIIMGDENILDRKDVRRIHHKRMWSKQCRMGVYFYISRLHRGISVAPLLGAWI